jgi:hypothetical protein
MIKFIKNLFTPRHGFIYQKKNGDQGFYVVTNCTAIKGSNATTFSNASSRQIGINSIGFRAKCLNRSGQVRSFYFDNVRQLRKLSIFERVVS